MTARKRHSRRFGFTLAELLTVVGLIALLVSLLMPVVSKTRAAARNTSCASSLRQMGVGWMAYLSDNEGRLPDYMFQMQPGNSAWYGYWPGILAKAGVMGQTLLCAGASEEAPSDRSAGFGSVQYAWTGKYSPVVNGSGVRLNDEACRVSSYGHNRYLTRNGFKRDGSANCLSAIKDAQNVPLFFDSAYADARPVNRGEKLPEPSPPDLRGDGLNETSPQHWRFLLARHGRGINVCFEDGSVRWVRLEESYMLMWNGSWTPYRLQLPMN